MKITMCQRNILGRENRPEKQNLAYRRNEVVMLGDRLTSARKGPSRHFSPLLRYATNNGGTVKHIDAKIWKTTALEQIWAL